MSCEINYQCSLWRCECGQVNDGVRCDCGLAESPERKVNEINITLNFDNICTFAMILQISMIIPLCMLVLPVYFGIDYTCYEWLIIYPIYSGGVAWIWLKIICFFLAADKKKEVN